MILLARHGQTADNVSPARVQGWRDPALDDCGRAQARELAAAVASEGLAALYTSHLLRARQTAEIVGEALGLRPCVDWRFAESRRGAWEGRALEDIEREDAELWAAWRRPDHGFRFPDAPDARGESLLEHQRRALAGLEDVRRGPLPALIVCHRGTIRCLMAERDPRGLRAFHEIEVAHAGAMRL